MAKFLEKNGASFEGSITNKKNKEKIWNKKNRLIFAASYGKLHKNLIYGGVPEWFNGAVLKTVVLKGTGGSNPSPSALRKSFRFARSGFFLFFNE